jgi:hypothetical protein
MMLDGSNGRTAAGSDHPTIREIGFARCRAPPEVMMLRTAGTKGADF